VLYGEGKGVSRNLIQAYMWFAIVAAKESDQKAVEAGQRRDAIEAEMSSDQLREAKRRVREWRPAFRPS
jgi:TPR repeat protein